MLVAGLGLGVVLVAVSVALLTGAPEDEAGMLSGLNTTGHEIGGSLGIAALVTIATGAVGGTSGPEAAAGLGEAFLAAGVTAGVAGVLALVILPSARAFLPRFRLAPRVAVH
jgi:hypothetical protein